MTYLGILFLNLKEHDVLLEICKRIILKVVCNIYTLSTLTGNSWASVCQSNVANIWLAKMVCCMNLVMDTCTGP